MILGIFKATGILSKTVMVEFKTKGNKEDSPSYSSFKSKLLGEGF